MYHVKAVKYKVTIFKAQLWQNINFLGPKVLDWKYLQLVSLIHQCHSWIVESTVDVLSDRVCLARCTVQSDSRVLGKGLAALILTDIMCSSQSSREQTRGGSFFFLQTTTVTPSGQQLTSWGLRYSFWFSTTVRLYRRYTNLSDKTDFHISYQCQIKSNPDFKIQTIYCY